MELPDLCMQLFLYVCMFILARKNRYQETFYSIWRVSTELRNTSSRLRVGDHRFVNNGDKKNVWWIRHITLDITRSDSIYAWKYRQFYILLSSTTLVQTSSATHWPQGQNWFRHHFYFCFYSNCHCNTSPPPPLTSIIIINIIIIIIIIIITIITIILTIIIIIITSIII